jgi:hypothetical protein
MPPAALHEKAHLMISPDQLADRLTPPLGAGALYAAQLALCDGGMELAEHILDTTRRGDLQDQALNHLIRALQAAYAACDPEARAPGDDQRLPWQLAEAAGHPDVDAVPAPPPTRGLVLDVGVWRLGVRTSPSLHALSRLVGLVLADHCGPSGLIADANQPTLHDLVRQTGLTLQAVHGHLQDLTAQRWIHRHALGEAAGLRRFHFQLRLPTPLAEGGTDAHAC